MKKNIVFSSGSLRMGGLQRVLIEVLQNIDREKYNISLIITDNSGDEDIFLKDIPQGINLYFLKPEELLRKTEVYQKTRKTSIYSRIMYNLMMWKERKIIPANAKKALEDIKENYGEIDLYIDYDWGATKYIDKLNLKRSVVWIHSSIPNLLGNKKSKIERFGKRLAKYSGIVAICDEMKEEIERIYPYLKGKVERVYNPFNFERIESLAQDRSELTKEQENLMKEKYFVAVSRLDNVQKDYPTLLKAMKLLKERGINEKLYIIGDGPDRKEIEKEIKELKLESEVRLIGLTKNPYVWMKNAQFFVHSSKYEGFGLVIVEAAILENAIISSNCPVGPKEILGNGEYGILFDVGDYKKLAEKLEIFCKDNELKKKYKEKVMLKALEFDSKKVIKEYEEIIEKLIKE